MIYLKQCLSPPDNCKYMSKEERQMPFLFFKDDAYALLSGNVLILGVSWR